MVLGKDAEYKEMRIYFRQAVAFETFTHLYLCTKQTPLRTSNPILLSISLPGIA